MINPSNPVQGAAEFTAKHASLAYLIQLAFGIESYQIAGQPNWLGTQFYDVAAKPEGTLKGTMISALASLQPGVAILICHPSLLH